MSSSNSAQTSAGSSIVKIGSSADELPLPREVERMSFLSFDEVQPRIKDIHQTYQTDIVTDLSKISE